MQPEDLQTSSIDTSWIMAHDADRMLNNSALMEDETQLVQLPLDEVIFGKSRTDLQGILDNLIIKGEGTFTPPKAIPNGTGHC